MTGRFNKYIRQGEMQKFKVLHDVDLDDLIRLSIKHERKDTIIGTHKIVVFVLHRQVFGFLNINGVDTDQVDGIIREIIKTIFEYKRRLLHVKGSYTMGYVDNIDRWQQFQDTSFKGGLVNILIAQISS